MANKNGSVIWITGLSGSGKTTLAKKLQKALPESIVLDGDELREALGFTKKGFDAASRLELAKTYARLARLVAIQGFTVIVATISLFHSIHQWNRDNLPGYFEIFLDIPEEIRKKRDPKGLYKGEKNGTVTQMAGSETAVELPVNPHLTIDSDKDIQLIIDAILRLIRSKS